MQRRGARAAAAAGGSSQAQAQQATRVVDDLLRQDQPLDEHQQELVISELEQQLASQSRAFRLAFATGAGGLAVFFAWTAASQATSPWQLRFVGELRPVVASSSAVAALASQAAALALASAGLLTQLPRRGVRGACLPASLRMKTLLWCGVMLALPGALYWANALAEMVARFGPDGGPKWELAWLPLGPLGFALLCCYVMSQLLSTAAELQKLQGLRYDLKAA